MQKEGVLKWVSRGRQRRAFFQVLKKPMTAGEIWQEARQLNPRIQLRDVCFLLRLFMKKGLVYCLAYERAKGSLFSWTEYGREILSLSGVHVHAPTDVDWNAYSFVVRAKIRRLIVGEMSLTSHIQDGMTAEAIRRSLCKKQSFWLRSITRALKGLEARGVIECTGNTKIGKRKLYQLTENGKRIARQWRGS